MPCRGKSISNASCSFAHDDDDDDAHYYYYDAAAAAKEQKYLNFEILSLHISGVKEELYLSQEERTHSFKKWYATKFRNKQVPACQCDH